MVLLKDIAKQCGVSVATVSKALNGQRDISEETRSRICQIADEMGYMTNSAARALKTNRTYNIGVLFVDEMNSGLAHEFFSYVLENLKSEAESHGYDVTFINQYVGKKKNTYLQHCIYRGVDGVVIANVDFNAPQVQELIESDLPVVTIDHVFNNRAAVVSDNVAGTEALVDYVAGRGYRNLAFIHGEKTSVTLNRLTGFHRACEKNGIPIREDYIMESAYHDPSGCYHVTQKLLSLPERPDCIFFPDDYSFIGGMNAIAEKGLKIPEDIAAVGYDGIPLSQMMHPKLTTYRQDTVTLGKVAAAKLIELIEHPKTTILDRVVVSGELVRGGSVAVKQ